MYCDEQMGAQHSRYDEPTAKKPQMKQCQIYVEATLSASTFISLQGLARKAMSRLRRTRQTRNQAQGPAAPATGRSALERAVACRY